ncbi:hypothetical protein DU500_17365 (plasmid) [Haloplanus rubicundus]|uniref:SWIM-type domain-containing protein n=2 Tax=Haloplanus rubicundus TaxID=1547898 RepID=A0A345E7T8_9EURY|nr:hypothetical protein DU500_17365 [Haloplanus rubicundus]
MPRRHIHASSSMLPSLGLPPGSLADIDAAYDYDVETDPPAIEPVEHRIRLDFMAGGAIRYDQLLTNYDSRDRDAAETDPWHHAGRAKPLGMQYAEGTCQRRLTEEARYYESYDDEDTLVDAPAFLAHRLRQARSAADPEAALRSERDRRETWYRTLIPRLNLCSVLKRSSYGTLIDDGSDEMPEDHDLLEYNGFVGVIVLDPDHDPETYARERNLPSRYVVREQDLSSGKVEEGAHSSEYGLDLPAPLLVGEYASGSRYSLLPWSDGLVCSCPFKTGAPWRVMCKHELLASIVLGAQESIFLPVTDGLDIPYRARRFVSPTVASTHTPQLPDDEWS